MDPGPHLHCSESDQPHLALWIVHKVANGHLHDPFTPIWQQIGVLSNIGVFCYNYLMPEKQTPERGLPVPEGQNSQPESDGGAFELQLQLFELQKAERILQRERERYRREEEALTEAQRESRRETLKADELERASNESTQKLIELDLRMGKAEQLKEVVEGKNVPKVRPLLDAAKNDTALAQIMDAYESVKELYNDSIKIWPPKTPQQRHMVAASAVAMRELLVLGHNRLNAIQRGIKTNENMLLKAQRRIPLGTTPDVLATTLTTEAAVDATFNSLASRAAALFSTENKPAIDKKMVEMSQYLSDDPRAMAIAEGFMTQMQRFVSLTQKKGSDGKVTSSISADPAELSQVEDALSWMERSADVLKRYAEKNPTVKQYMDGTLSKAVVQSKPEEVPQTMDEPKTIEKKATRKTPEKTNKVESTGIPERIDQNAKTIQTSSDTFQQWEDTWIESGKNSFFDAINARYKVFREIRRNDKENALIVSTYEKLSPMLKRYAELESAIPRLTGQEAQASDMRAIEQILIDIEAALTEFEFAWSKKDAPADNVPAGEDAKVEKGSNLTQRAQDLLLRGLDISNEKEIEKQPTVPTESASPAIETVEDSRTFSIPRTAPFQIEVKDDARRTRHLPFTVALNTSATRHGPVQINSTRDQWTLSVPQDFRGTVNIVQNGVEQKYAYGVNGSTVETQTPVTPNVQKSIPFQPTIPAAQARETFAGSVVEYFQQPGGINRLTQRVEAMFAGRSEMLKDKAEYGGSVEWKTYAQESQQLLSRYLLSLSNGNWPTEQSKRIELLAAVSELEQVIADYKLDRPNLPHSPDEKQDGPWKDAEKQKLPWDKRVTAVTAAYDKLKAEFKSVDNPKMKEVYDEFRKTMAIYSNIYLRLTAPNVYRDDRQIAATVEQMERVLHYYEPKLRDIGAIAVQPVSAEKKADGGFFGGLLNKATEMAGTVTENGASNAALEKTVMDNMFKPGQPRFEIRQNLILGSTLKPLQKLSEQEVESLLYIKAHLPDFAGMDGRLNANDLAAVVDSIHRDVMSRPYDLHKTIMREKNIQPGSYQDVGLQKALGLVQVMSAQESQLYNKGLNAESRPLTRWFFRTFRGADYNKLQNAKAQLGQLYAVRAQIPSEVRANIDKQLKDFVEKSHLPSHASTRDRGHAPVTEADMRAFEKHAAVLKEVSKRSLKDVVDRTGAKIETYLPDGLSVEFIDWMLDAQTRADGRKGTPPGSTFWIEGAPVSTAAERRAKAGPVANNKKTSSPEESDTSIDLGSPSVDLGSPAIDLGAPSDMPENAESIPSVKPQQTIKKATDSAPAAPVSKPSVTSAPPSIPLSKIERVKPTENQIDGTIPSEFLEKVDVPKNVQERFAVIDKAYSDLYKKVFSPNYRIKEEQYLDQVMDPTARAAMVRDVESLKTEVRNQVVKEWREARAQFANAPEASSGNSFSFNNLLKPSGNSVVAEKFIAARAEEYKAAKNDVERARMFAEDAKLRPFLPLTAKQIEALILMKALLPKIAGPDGKLNTKDDMAGYAKGKRETRDTFGTAYPEVTPLEQQFGDAAEVIDTIGAADRRNPQGALKQLEKAIGATIKTDPMNGLNIETIDWMLAAQKSPTAPTGLPAGMTVRFGQGEQILISDISAETGSVGPEVDLGSPSQ